MNFKWYLKLLRFLVQAILENEKIATDEVNIYFVDKKDISDIHMKYFNDPTPTDSISFPIDSQEDDSYYKILGDVFVCTEVGILIGGPGPIKEQFSEGEFLHFDLRKKVLGTVNTSYTGDYGLRETVERSEELIREASVTKECSFRPK